MPDKNTDLLKMAKITDLLKMAKIIDEAWEETRVLGLTPPPISTVKLLERVAQEARAEERVRVEKRTINPDTCCSECKRYGTTPSKFPIWCSDNNCSCHTSIQQAEQEMIKRVEKYNDEQKSTAIWGDEYRDGFDHAFGGIWEILSSLDKPLKKD